MQINAISIVIPAQAGIQKERSKGFPMFAWTPAFAGVTASGVRHKAERQECQQTPIPKRKLPACFPFSRYNPVHESTLWSDPGG
jgi:hypothetical protein